ncbi:MAG TPA: sigma-70 family RNA polymerase sigma factor [Thermoanaerobaculia bacterium]|nr:sigma-70 family RNA polymerase sigma factor [Thermoanaerobaculia bacterium]
MDTHEFLAQRFESHRQHLRAVAFRMLGSLDEADDAVQQAWLRLSRADTSGVENLGGWLTTVVARVCLDMLRSRESRREEPLEAISGPVAGRAGPEDEALLADSVGLALLVVLDMLPPAERLAFVLHDLFAMPFEEIAPIVGRSLDATRQLASRARRRVQGAEPPDRDRERQRQLVDAFLAAARAGDFDALLAVLDPDIVVRSDRAAQRPDTPAELRGAREVAARAMRGRARAARPVLIDGDLGVVVAPRGRLMMVLRFTIAGGRISAIDAIADPEHLRRLELRVPASASELGSELSC